MEADGHRIPKGMDGEGQLIMELLRGVSSIATIKWRQGCGKNDQFCVPVQRMLTMPCSTFADL
jgi:hypothetical protein